MEKKSSHLRPLNTRYKTGKLKFNGYKVKWNVKLHRSRLQRAEGYLEPYQTHQKNVGKMGNSPYLKGKIRISPSSRQEYEEARGTCEIIIQGFLKKEGVSGSADFYTVGKMEAKLPQVERQIKAQESGLGLLEGIISGIYKASRKPNRRKQQQGE